MTTCAICLEDIDSSTHVHDVLCMPVCHHRLHTVCALRAAQYDLKCPVCRTRDPSFESAAPADEETAHATLLRQLGEIGSRHAVMQQRYQRRRTRAIRQNAALLKLKNRLAAENIDLQRSTRDLERQWVLAQRTLWKEDICINEIKTTRRRHQQRSSALTRRLDARVELELGPPPSINIEYLFHAPPREVFVESHADPPPE